MLTIDRLMDRVRELKAPVVVGIDPVYERIPLAHRKDAGGGIGGAVRALESFSYDIVDAVAGVVPAVKPQMGFFECYGSDGVRAFERVSAYAHEHGLLVIEDAKRNDIGSTARAYAEGHLGTVVVEDGRTRSSYGADFLTVSPYEGAEGLDPFVEVARREGKGVFVLVKTSNAGSLAVQGARTEEGDTVYEALARYVDAAGEGTVGSSGYSGIGAVVGATYPEQASRLRGLMPRSLFLVPGYGAQGAGAQEIVPCFNDDGLGALVNSSRGIIYAYEKTCGADCTREEYRDATRHAAESMRDDIYRTLIEHCEGMSY